jgi:AsmA protein
MTLPRSLRLGLVAIAVIVVLAIGAAAVAVARFDPNSLKPRIIEAVKRATGRDLSLNGTIGLKVSLSPTLRVTDVALANPPGFSRPQMATLHGLELQLGLLPLLAGRYEIDKLALIDPEIRLETDTAGHLNWQLTPQASPAAPGGTQVAPEPGEKKRTVVSIDSITVQNGSVIYRDDRTGAETTLGLQQLEADAASPESPLHVKGDASYNGTAFNVVADTGSLARLQDAAATSAWPVRLTLTAVGAKLAAEGTFTQPLLAKGYHLAVNGTIPDLAGLTPLLNGYQPPRLRDVSFAANVADSGNALPDISSVTAHIGASDLGDQIPGLSLDKLDIAAAASDQPAKAAAAGKFGDAPLTLTATTGPLALLLPGAAPQVFPLDATVQAAGATLTAKGSLADVRAWSGASIALAAQIPDLSALSPLVRRPLPGLKTVAFQATLTDAAGGFRNGGALRGLALTSAEGDVAGEASIGLRPRDSLTAALTSSRIDLDSIGTTVDNTPAASPEPGSAPPPAASPKRNERLFSDQPLPFGLLRDTDADIKLDIGLLRSAGADYKAVKTHVLLANGKLAVDPFSAETPSGHLSGTLSADANVPAPPVHLVLHAPGLALKALLALLRQPPIATGALEVHANLSGSGDSPHAIASSLDGSLGLAVAGGTVDNRLLGSMLGKGAESLNALNLVGKGGSSELKCFAVRMDAQRGTGTVQPLALSSSLLTMTGSGTLNLGSETLALELRPQARLGGTNVTIPIHLSGPFRNPRAGVEKFGAAESNVGSVASAVIGSATPLGIVGGLIGGDKLLGGSTDICPAALAEARGQAAPQPAASAKQPSLQNPGALLKNLFR